MQEVQKIEGGNKKVRAPLLQAVLPRGGGKAGVQKIQLGGYGKKISDSGIAESARILTDGISRHWFY